MFLIPEATMDADKYSRSVILICPTCGHKDFEREDDNPPLRCTGCDRAFSREELIRENGEIIEAEVDEVKAELIADFKKEFSDRMRKAFKGSKHIKFK
jgi:hypothetical protein